MPRARRSGCRRLPRGIRVRAPARDRTTRPGRGRRANTGSHATQGPREPGVPPNRLAPPAALDRPAGWGPDAVGLEMGGVGEAPPPAPLVDGRLADVEDDRL